eukprot:4122416-Prymnesium_polylepis.1
MLVRIVQTRSPCIPGIHSIRHPTPYPPPLRAELSSGMRASRKIVGDRQTATMTETWSSIEAQLPTRARRPARCRPAHAQWDSLPPWDHDACVKSAPSINPRTER